MKTNENRNYVAGWYDWATDKVIILERDQDGTLFRVKYSAPYYFYVEDEEGEFTALTGEKLIKCELSSREEYDAARRQFPKKFESDFRPLQRVLMDYYYGRPVPPVNYAFLDIEVDYAQKIGFAGPTNPYAEINAVTIYQSWTKKFFTYVLTPFVDMPDGSRVKWDSIPGNTIDKLYAEINKLIELKQLREGMVPEIKICSSEMELLSFMLADIQEADIISGWNSEFYDIPYIAERLLLLGGQPMLNRLEHLGVRGPKKEMVNRFGTEEPVYKFQGRSHLDYMKLFQKFTFEGRVSYSLGNILQEEVGVGKLDYEGTLEQLYHNDFPTFVAYNFRDVDGLVQLDSKFKFIAIANQMAHENTVVFDSIMGTVSYVETGITNHAHYKMDRIVNDKNIVDNKKVEGAVVLTPWIGLHSWTGSVDLNSLYPNTIRALNISPEMIIGQFEQQETAWRDIYEERDTRHCFVYENGTQDVKSSSEWLDVLLEKKWAVSAYGTVFDQSKGRGVVADILGYWYTERKRLQAEKKKFAKLVKTLPDGPEKDEAIRQEEQFDLLQLTKKISMNSLYGALLNAAFRFGDERMGASVTGTGRQITSFMIENIGEYLTGDPHKLEKRYDPNETERKRTHQSSNVRGVPNTFGAEDWLNLPTKPSIMKNGKETMPIYRAFQTYPDGLKAFSNVIIYGDTDSCYYLCNGAENKDEAVLLADGAAANVNEAFPAFMRKAFNCQPEFDDFIKAGREIVAVRGMFQAKKKYMVKVVDLEGFAVDKLKTQGSEIKKADTPKIIQTFLKSTVDMILDGVDYDTVTTHVNQQRKAILKNKKNVFFLGVAKQVNNLDKYAAEYAHPGTIPSASGGKLTIPGHARAACNYNFCLNMFEKGAKAVKSGDKVLVYYLKKNTFGFDSMAMPAELSRFPKWFDENFVVDVKTTEDRMFDSKLSGIFEAWGKEVPSPQVVLTNSILEF